MLFHCIVMDTGLTRQSLDRCEMKYKDAEKLKTAKPIDYIYRINLNERGEFRADVYREDTNQTVFEINAGDSLADGESSIFDDGYMRHENDIAGLNEYLVSVGIMRSCDRLFDGP